MEDYTDDELKALPAVNVAVGDMFENLTTGKTHLFGDSEIAGFRGCGCCSENRAHALPVIYDYLVGTYRIRPGWRFYGNVLAGEL